MKRRTFLIAGAATFAPVGKAQAVPRGKPWHIVWLVQASTMGPMPGLDAFRDEFKRFGYVEGADYLIDVRGADGHSDRLDALAKEMVARRVDLIVAISTPSAIAAMRATRDIPIVMANTADPVGSGLVRSLSHPGGNVTGTAWALNEVSRKWLELLKELRSSLSRVSVLQNSTNQSMSAMLRPLETSARALAITLTIHDFTRAEMLSPVFSAVAASRAEGIVVLPDSFLAEHRWRIAENAQRLRLPTIYAVRPYVEAGGLMSYGPDQVDGARRAARYVDKILKGTKPADLPVEQPSNVLLVINVKTARAIGVTIPRALLVRADEVID